MRADAEVECQRRCDKVTRSFRKQDQSIEGGEGRGGGDCELWLGKVMVSDRIDKADGTSSDFADGVLYCLDGRLVCRGCNSLTLC